MNSMNMTCWRPIDNTAKTGEKMILTDADFDRVEDGVWFTPAWASEGKFFRKVWPDGGTMGLSFTPAYYMPLHLQIIKIEDK